MAFNAQAFRAAYTAPVYTDLAGVPHTGQLLSRFQWLAVQDDATTLDQGTPDEQQAKAQRVLEAFFPGQATLVTEILALPSRMFDEAVGDFFGCQRPPQSSSASAS
jgi:hypothetical protein